MVTTTGSVSAGSFIGHDIDHWSVTGVDLTSAAIASAMVECIETKATIIELGALKNASGATSFSTESPSAWTKASLEAATDLVTALAAAVFTAVTY